MSASLAKAIHVIKPTSILVSLLARINTDLCQLWQDQLFIYFFSPVSQVLITFFFLYPQQEREDHSQQAITAYLKNARKDHQRILARRQTIEERKERLESLNIQREKEELEQREAELQKVRKAEEERLRQEAKEREKERIMQEHEQIKKKTVRERLEQIKKTELGAKAFKDIDIEVKLLYDQSVIIHST